MIVAIVGSREKWFRDPEKAKGRVHQILCSLPKGCIVHTGDASSGVDRWVRDFFDEEELPLVLAPPFEAEWDRLGKAAGHIRNSQVIEEANEVHVVWDGQSPGSADVINKVRWTQQTYGTKVLHEHRIK